MYATEHTCAHIYGGDTERFGRPNYKPGDFRIEQFDFNELDQQKAENFLPELKDLRKKANQVV